MKAIPGGVDKVTHPNVNATETKARPAVSTYNHEAKGFDLSGDATNCISRPKDLGMAESPHSRKHSFNQHRGGR